MIEKNCLYPQFINNRFIPCGNCPICKTKKSAEWSTRAKHENNYEHDGIMLTFTYNDENLPRQAFKKENENDCRGSLQAEDITKFLKRLRKKHPDKKLRYIYCGEYGGSDLMLNNKNYEENKNGTWRPHYHMILWGLKGTVKKETLEKIWKKGFVTVDYDYIDDHMIEYICGYVTKKIEREDGKIHYEMNNREKPFIRASKGLGDKWRNKNEVNMIEYGVIRTKKGDKPIPRYYIKKIYESEGKKIKLENKRTIGTIFPNGEIITHEEQNTYYKIFINPNGEKTKKLLKKLKEIKIQKIKKDKDLSEKDKENMILYEETLYNVRQQELETEWQYVMKHTDGEIKAKYETNKMVINNETKNSYENKFVNLYLDEQTQKELQSKARIKEYFIKLNMRKKKRNGIQKQEIIDEFTKIKKLKKILDN